jgi:hypothetical protein
VRCGCDARNPSTTSRQSIFRSIGSQFSGLALPNNVDVKSIVSPINFAVASEIGIVNA